MLNYLVFGSADNPTLLFLHGFMGSSADWVEIAQQFSAEYHIIIPDLPGHGRSHFSEAAHFAMPAAAQQLIDILDKENIETCTPIGYSMGGRVALFLATQFPQRVAKLLLESSSPGLKTAEERAARRKWDESVAQKISEQPLPQFLADWYAMPLFDSLRRHPHYANIVAGRAANDAAQLALSMRHMGTGSQPSLWPAWQNLEIETLLLVGELDKKYVGISAEMASLNSHATAMTLPAVGHNAHAENADQFISILKSFIAEEN